MRAVQRSARNLRMFRRLLFRLPEKRYYISGDRACKKLMQKAQRSEKPDPEAAAIYAWARYELNKEIQNGFWNREAVYTV